MNVILLEKISKLGQLGDQVNVKSGFARNFLLPQKKAVLATASNIEKFALKRAELERLAAEHLAQAQERATRLNVLTVTIAASTSDEGRLFGSIGTREIADAVTAAGTPAEKHEVLLPEGPIRQVGEYPIEIRVHPDVIATVTVKVVTE